MVEDQGRRLAHAAQPAASTFGEILIVMLHTLSDVIPIRDGAYALPAERWVVRPDSIPDPAGARAPVMCGNSTALLPLQIADCRFHGGERNSLPSRFRKTTGRASCVGGVVTTVALCVERPVQVPWPKMPAAAVVAWSKWIEPEGAVARGVPLGRRCPGAWYRPMARSAALRMVGRRAGPRAALIRDSEPSASMSHGARVCAASRSSASWRARPGGAELGARGEPIVALQPSKITETSPDRVSGRNAITQPRQTDVDTTG
jgi:hypothetical protein